jgi:hypothetical protein
MLGDCLSYKNSLSLREKAKPSTKKLVSGDSAANIADKEKDFRSNQFLIRR